MFGLLNSSQPGWAAQAEPYRGLKPDEFMRHWLVLKSIPVSSDAKITPSDQEQRRAFARDWLEPAGGPIRG